VTPPPPSSILVGQVGDAFWIRIDGRGCFQNSVYVQDVINHMLALGIRTFIIDLDRCPMMDSTFMGTLTGAALNLTESGGGTIAVVNANTRNQQLLSNLGLDSILAVDEDGSSWTEQKAQVATALKAFEAAEQVSKEEQAEHVLKAHQALCKANQANALRFQDVIDFLKKDLPPSGQEP
jgi:anti-sigma B factor antagonist